MASRHQTLKKKKKCLVWWKILIYIQISTKRRQSIAKIAKIMYAIVTCREICLLPEKNNPYMYCSWKITDLVRTISWHYPLIAHSSTKLFCTFPSKISAATCWWRSFMFRTKFVYFTVFLISLHGHYHIRKSTETSRKYIWGRGWGGGGWGDDDIYKV